LPASSKAAWGKHPIATARFSADNIVMTHSLLAASYLSPVGFRLAIQAVVLVVAVIAARRYKLTGLWILAVAVFLAVFQDIMGLVASSLIGSGHDSAMAGLAWLQYVPWATMILVLCGWCVLAFGHKQGGRTL
jgi:hypothetical protein